VYLSLGDWLRDYLHVTAEAGGIRIGLRKLAVEPDGVVAGQLGQDSVDLFINLSGDRASILLAGHDSLVNAAGEVAIWATVAFINDTLEIVALPTHVVVTVIHRTGSVTVREDEWLLGILS